MPAGPGPLGLIYYIGVKIAGYTAAAHYLNRHFEDRKTNIYLVGVSRTLIGLAAGTGSMALLALLPGAVGNNWLFFILLIPIRYLEWMGLLWIFYRKPEWHIPAMTRLAAKGIAWSFCLDVPAILSVFVLPGGIWIC